MPTLTLPEILSGKTELEVVRLYTPMVEEIWNRMDRNWKNVFLVAATEFLTNVRLGCGYDLPWPSHTITATSCCSLRKERVVG